MQKITEDKHEFACMICGSTLDYSDEPKEYSCYYCHSKSVGLISCPEGHYVCDACHSNDALEFLRALSEREDIKDVGEIINLAFSHPSFTFHGPEHHSLVPLAILLTLRNRGIQKPDGTDLTLNDLLEGIRRGSAIPGGFCGYAGSCGGCIGAGIAIAIFLGSTPKKPKERNIATKATQIGLEMARDKLVRCCKRSTFYGVTAAIEVLNELGIDIGPKPERHSCRFWERSPDCERNRCKYFPLNDTVTQ